MKQVATKKNMGQRFAGSVSRLAMCCSAGKREERQQTAYVNGAV
jgi:hypothetical protein